MKRTSFLRGLAPCLLFSAAAPAADSLPPAEAFGRMPAESEAVLSPDGHWVAWLDRKESKPRVIMFDVPGRKVQRILAVPEDVKLRQLVWNDNETLLTVLSQTAQSKQKDETSDEFFRTVAHDVSGGNGRMLPSMPVRNLHTRLAQARLGDLVADRISTPQTVVVATYDECRCLWRIDTRTGGGDVVAYGNGFTTGWVVDRSGRAVAREDWDWQHHSYRVLALGERADEKVREILRKDDSERPKLAGLLQDSQAVVLLATNDRNFQAAWALPLDGSPAKIIAEDPDADITRVFTDPYSGAITGVYVDGSVTRIKWLDAAAEHRQEVLNKSFRGKQVQVYDWTADGSKTLAEVQTPSSPPVYYLVDFTAHRADIVAEEYPALANVALGEVQEITYQARDGTQIPGYLTLPPAKPTGPLPLIVLPHGGPQARDQLTFDWLSQFLATRGYAVLRPQFRGSTGFGKSFQEAGYRQWGGLMQDDVTDGVHALIERGIADPQHICIVGASYGGYAALAGATFTPDLYRCAVSLAGISDLQAFMREQAPYVGVLASTALAHWKEHIGAPRDPNLAAKSPINSVKSVKAPILIMYGTDDGVVPVDQSLKMASALKEAGKEVKLVALEGEDHWLSRTETRVQVLKELDSFLREHL